MNDEELIIDLNKSKTLDRIVVNRYGRNEAIYSYLYMYPLSDVEERFIDEIKRKLKENDNANTRIKLADGIIISISDIKVYGEVDLNDASDCQAIKELNVIVFLKDSIIRIILVHLKETLFNGQKQLII